MPVEKRAGEPYSPGGRTTDGGPWPSAGMLGPMDTLVRTTLSFLLLLSAACGDGGGSGIDAGGRADAGGDLDAGPDANGGDAATGEDAGAPDAGGPVDAGFDGGTPGSVGCVSGDGIPEGENTFTLDGLERRYVLHLPTGYTRDQAWPLIFALHGNGGSVDYWNQTGGTRNIRGAVENDAILVIAEAIDNQWRDYSMPSDTWPARIEKELDYFDTLVDRLTSELCVDEEEIFSMGFSGGGSFSGVLGCRREYVRAIAVGGSVIYFDEADCVSTPASWITIGIEELTSGREAFRDFFRDAAMCEATNMSTEPSPCVAYDGCAAETPVHYCQHDGGHTWPAFATEATWAFFQRFID